MEPPGKILLCTWHIDKNIRKNLPLIQGGIELKAEIYKLIRTVMVETNLENFNELLKLTVNRLLTDPATQAFGKYFDKEYASRAPMWAYAHRLYIGINTNMKLEAMHRVLKQVYFEGRKIKRLDQAIYLLLKMNRDRIFDRATNLVMNADTHTLRTIRQRHKAGQLIQRECVSLINPSTYMVTSQTDKSNLYTVTKLKDDCNCNLRCLLCNICVHSFTCACLNNSIQGHICKHIHAVVIHFGGVQNNQDLPDAEDAADKFHLHNVNQEAQDDMLNLAVSQTPVHSESQNMSKETEGNILLQSLKPRVLAEINPNNSKNAVDDFVNEVKNLAIFSQQLDREDSQNIAVCKDAVKALRMCTDLFARSSTKKKLFASHSQEPWNKKADKQLRFYSTKKKRFNPYAASLNKPTKAQMAEITAILKDANDTQISHVHSTFDHIYN